MRTRWVIIWLFAAFIAKADEADRVCAHAVQLHQSGDFQAAIGEYKSCLTLRPDAAQLRSNLGAALAQAGRYEEAIQEYEQALKVINDPRLRRNLALAYYKAGDIPKAAAELENVHAGAPNDFQTTLLLADCRLQTGDFKKVIELLTPLENQEAEKQAVAYLLGTALIRSGEVAKGQLMIDRILSAGDSAEARFLVATAAFVNGDYPGAVKGFASAIELNPDVPSLQSYYGQALLITGDPDGASTAFRKELAHNANDFEANLKLGSIMQFRHQYEEAIPYLQRALMVRAASLEARFALAQVYASAGKTGDAKSQYEKLVSDAPGFAAAHAGLAKVYDSLDRKADAQKQRKIAASLEAKSPSKSAAEEAGLLAPGTIAPDFTLGNTALAALRKDKPVVLVFGSYTCPKFRFDAGALNKLYDQFGNRAHFLLVYVQEAHSDADWQSTANQREGVTLPPAKTIEEKTQHATMCTRKLPIRFPSVVDGMDRKVENAYRGWPSAIYLVRRDGTIAYVSRLGEQEFSTTEMEKALSRESKH